eukprot:9322400-Pyramimonas_sp.AAC.2
MAGEGHLRRQAGVATGAEGDREGGGERLAERSIEAPRRAVHVGGHSVHAQAGGGSLRGASVDHRPPTQEVQRSVPDACRREDERRVGRPVEQGAEGSMRPLG